MTPDLTPEQIAAWRESAAYRSEHSEECRRIKTLCDALTQARSIIAQLELLVYPASAEEERRT